MAQTSATTCRAWERERNYQADGPQRRRFGRESAGPRLPITLSGLSPTQAQDVRAADGKVSTCRRRGHEAARELIRRVFAGLTDFRPNRTGEFAVSSVAPQSPALLRPLGEYEAIVGGGF
jgi:hypothetical protein